MMITFSLDGREKLIPTSVNDDFKPGDVEWVRLDDMASILETVHAHLKTAQRKQDISSDHLSRATKYLGLAFGLSDYDEEDS
jgi:hypothetical protein